MLSNKDKHTETQMKFRCFKLKSKERVKMMEAVEDKGSFLSCPSVRSPIHNRVQLMRTKNNLQVKIQERNRSTVSNESVSYMYRIYLNFLFLFYFICILYIYDFLYNYI